MSTADPRERILRQAGYLCGYCRSSQRIKGCASSSTIYSRVRVGEPITRTTFGPHASHVMGFKQDRVQARDPLDDSLVPLFNPRHQRWTDHFAWEDRGRRIVGLTPRGRATVLALHRNRDELIEARSLWIEASWHPPREDTQEA